MDTSSYFQIEFRSPRGSSRTDELLHLMQHDEARDGPQPTPAYHQQLTLLTQRGGFMTTVAGLCLLLTEV